MRTNGGFVNLILFIVVALALLYFFGSSGYEILVWVINAIRDLLVGLLNILRQLLNV